MHKVLLISHWRWGISSWENPPRSDHSKITMAQNNGQTGSTVFSLIHTHIWRVADDRPVDSHWQTGYCCRLTDAQTLNGVFNNRSPCIVCLGQRNLIKIIYSSDLRVITMVCTFSWYLDFLFMFFTYIFYIFFHFTKSPFYLYQLRSRPELSVIQRTGRP